MKSKISYKLITYIFIISFIVTSISIYFQLQQTYTNQIHEFENKINTIEKNRLPILSQALWNVNVEAVELFLENIINDPAIIFAKVIEADGMTKTYGEEKLTNVIKKEFSIIKTINKKDNTIGRLIIIADLDPVYTKLKEYAFSIIITETIKMLLIALLIIFVIKKFLTNSIESMADYANKLSIETLDKPLEIKQVNKKENEIDIVVKAINHMRQNLLNEITDSRKKDTILAHQSKLAAMGEMLGNIAHQWRQPLSVISSSSSSVKLNQELNQLDEKDIVKSMDNILKATKYLSSTIDDFRDYFRPNKTKEHFELSKCLDKVYVIVDQHYKTLNIKLVKPKLNCDLYGYQNELIQVLLNLLNNAKDELVKKDTDRLIIIDVTCQKEHTKLTIQDNAGGIPEDIISRIFEPYFTTKDQKQGTGIGLYIAQEIISKHMNGKLEVQNETFTYEELTGKGAKFTITLFKEDRT